MFLSPRRPAFRCPFFFSSRRRHTSCYRDRSSDVCSSDLGAPQCIGGSEQSYGTNGVSPCGGDKTEPVTAPGTHITESERAHVLERLEKLIPRILQSTLVRGDHSEPPQRERHDLVVVHRPCKLERPRSGL